MRRLFLVAARAVLCPRNAAEHRAALRPPLSKVVAAARHFFRREKLRVEKKCAPPHLCRALAGAAVRASRAASYTRCVLPVIVRRRRRAFCASRSAAHRCAALAVKAPARAGCRPAPLRSQIARPHQPPAVAQPGRGRAACLFPAAPATPIGQLAAAARSKPRPKRGAPRRRDRAATWK
jgi:hypothetical protein